MNRLTGWNCGKVFYRHGEESGIQTYADRPPHGCVEAIERLAAYEDTGLTPEEVVDHEEMFKAYRHICGSKSPDEIQQALADLDRYRTAEQEGRLLELPCKIGSTIWTIKFPTVLRDDGEWTSLTYKGATVEPLKFALCHLNSIGKLYWLTPEEAEKELQVKLKGERR